MTIETKENPRPREVVCHVFDASRFSYYTDPSVSINARDTSLFFINLVNLTSTIPGHTFPGTETPSI